MHHRALTTWKRFGVALALAALFAIALHAAPRGLPHTAAATTCTLRAESPAPAGDVGLGSLGVADHALATPARPRPSDGPPHSFHATITARSPRPAQPESTAIAWARTVPLVRLPRGGNPSSPRDPPSLFL